MMHLPWACVAFLASFQSLVWGQKLEDWALAGNLPDLSSDCAQALNTTVSDCPDLLGSVSVDNPRLNAEQLEALCTSACYSSLGSVRSTISAACGQSDVIDLDGIIWPATLIIDRLIYTYDLSCQRDSSTQKYCDELFIELLNGPEEVFLAQNCSDCMLGTIQVQLNSPFGWDEELAEDFQSMTASCGSAGYDFTSPVPYAIETKEPEIVVEEPTCLEPYGVTSGDTCDSIALAHEVPTFAVIRAGALDPECNNLRAGQSLCLPAPCNLYRVQFDDTCESIVASVPGLTATDFLSWNPNISVLCRNIMVFVESLVCVSPPGGDPADMTASIPPPAPSEDPEVAVPKPPNGKDESNYPCAEWYTVEDGDYCQAVSIRRQIELQDFYFLNPSLDDECTNLLLDIAYCVRAVGDINTYSDYPYSTSPAYTLTSATYTTTTMTLPELPFHPTTIVPLPTAPGSEPDCAGFVEHVPIPPRVDQYESPDTHYMSKLINTCIFHINNWQVSLEDFYAWNPSLAALDECELQEGYRYCALNDTSYQPIEEDPRENTLCLDIDEPFPGTDPSCSCFTLIFGVEVGIVTCEDLASGGEISVAQLLAWNPWIGPDCDTDVYSGLGNTDSRPLCIDSGSTVPEPSTSSTRTSTATSTSSDTETHTTTDSSPTAAPTRPGMVEYCNKLHTVEEGDGGCWAIANQHGIALEQFYAWNPSVGDDCSGLWLGYAYCVGIDSDVPAPPSPIQPGTPTTCSRYHQVVSGDGCWSIQQAYGIDFATLHKWNPGIGSDCGNIWLGYYLCVAGGPN